MGLLFSVFIKLCTVLVALAHLDTKASSQDLVWDLTLAALRLTVRCMTVVMAQCDPTQLLEEVLLPKCLPFSLCRRLLIPQLVFISTPVGEHRLECLMWGKSSCF